MIWGIIFLVIGLSFILDHLFGFDFPVARVIFGGLLIYWGIKVIFGGFGINFQTKKIVTDSEIMFSTGNFNFPSKPGAFVKSKKENEYVTLFGEATLDLTQVDLTEKPITLKINTVFGKSTVLVPKNLPLIVKSTVAFGNSDVLTKKTTAFGDSTYESENAKTGNALTLELATVFGQVEIKEN